MANTYLSRTFGTPTNANIWTYSVWIKRSQLGADQCFLSAGTGATDRTEISFSASDYIAIYRNIGGSTAGVETSELYRDTSGWYNLVFQNNSGTMTIYVNGETVTQNTSSLGTNRINQASVVHQIGEIVATGNPLNALMSHINFVDGTIYAPTAFGETDATTGEWKIKTSPSVTYGNNGFFILKDGNSVTDQSGEGNNFTVASGTLTKTEDSPSNVFATMNPLIPGQTNYTYSNGNNTITQGSAAWVKSNSTLGMSSGKYYWEAKYVSGSYTVVGVDKTDTATPYPSTSSSAVGWKRNGNVEVATTPQTDIASYAHGDIVSVALDMDNGCVYFGKAGVWQNSGDPTSGSSKTGAYSLPSYVANTPYFATVSPYGSGATSMNFGNGYFGTTAVSSAGTNASGIGIFEYDVPTGYTALSTKGLNL